MERIGVLKGIEYWVDLRFCKVVFSYEPENDMLFDSGINEIKDYSCKYLFRKARTEALAKMPKRVELELENDIKTGFLNSNIIDKIYWNLRQYPEKKLVKVIIEEVQE